jgi:hypothetical protein
MENQEKKFIEGLFTSRRENCPEFIIANLSFKTDRFIEWLKNNTNAKGYCNIDIKRSKSGTIYSELNDWKPKENTQNDNFEIPEDKLSDIPF